MRSIPRRFARIEAEPEDATDEGVAARWNANADQWTADVRAGFDRYRDLFTWPAFQRFAGALSDRRVVDFGCGEGTNTRRMASAGAHMTGIDVSQCLIDYARAAERDQPLGISYRVTSYSSHTGLPSASFDTVVSTLALMDDPDLPGAMREAHRVLRPGGWLLFSMLHPCFVTPGLRWAIDEMEAVSGLIVSDYFGRTVYAERWQFGDRPRDDSLSPFVTPRFPRTLSDTMNAVADAGFRIAAVEEPRPTTGAVAKVPRFARWRDLGAFLLMVRAERLQ